MAKFYFVRHGEADVSDANKKIYQDWGFNMLTLSEKGIAQIKNSAKDERLKGADIIITSPFGRALHTAAILSKELGVDIKVENDLHEWIPDASYKYLNDEDSYNSFKEFCMNRGIKNENCKYNFETVDSIKNRVNSVLDKYKKYNKVIVVSHGVVIQCFLDVMELNNGQVEEYDLK